MPKSARAKPLTLLAATAVVGVFAVVSWQYRHEIWAQYLLWRDL